MLDGVRARRSTGSVLKPFLYALAIERGPYTPQSLIEDIPTYYRGFSPQNAERNFSGIIPLKDALTNSLNVPAVRVMADYGVEDFHYYMKSAGLKGLFRIPQDYGLSLILGGGEASLLELVPLYSMLMNDGEKTPLQWLENSPQTRKREQLLQAVTAYHIREILNETKKPRQIAAAYKTGTSYGSRDAWALGVNAQWTIGVWVGNFAGGSVSGLSGANTASPLLFSLFESLDDNKLPQWRGLPSNADFETVEICNLSGYKAGDFCIDTKPLILPINRNINSKCSIHKRTIISKSNSFAVCSLCWDVDDTVSVIEEHYSPAVMAQLRKNGTLKSPPLAHNPHCRASRESTAPFNITYPQNAARLFLPSQDALNEMGFVATAAHTQKDAQLQWFLDAAFLGTTYNSHKMPIRTGKGEHRLGVQDTLGRYTEIKFTVNVK
jgi:penicillin-binding protein 1C